MLELPDVTLCCVYTNCHELTLMAVDECLKHARFGDVKLFTDKSMGRDVIKLDKPSNFEEFSRICRHEPLKYVKTSHMLLMQWDSWIINPSAWRQEFLSYDYIGAPWWYEDNYNVGNSGFCLRSKRLMDYLVAHEDEFPIREPEDHVLCREYRKHLPQFSWAPVELAWHFSFENSFCYPLNETFGFHSLLNWPIVMTADALQERLDLVIKEPYITMKPEFYQVLKLRLPPNSKEDYYDSSRNLLHFQQRRSGHK